MQPVSRMGDRRLGLAENRADTVAGISGFGQVANEFMVRTSPIWLEEYKHTPSAQYID